MTVLPWILGCAVVCTGISCLILLNQQNSPKLKHVHMDVSENGCILPHRKECLLYDQEYAIRWPDLAIAFEKDESSGIRIHACLRVSFFNKSMSCQCI